MAERRGRHGRPGGYTFLEPEGLEQALRHRRVAEAEIDRVASTLSGHDPAGVLLQAPTREQVAHVAAYLHQLVGAAWVPNRAWRLLEQGHPAARAIWCHESQQLESYRLLGVRNPLEVELPGTSYWQAHARASWQEARYWEAWAAAEGEAIPARLFLRAHPWREPEEVEGILRALRETWKIDVARAGVLELERARQFHRAKRLTSRAGG